MVTWELQELRQRLVRCRREPYRAVISETLWSVLWERGSLLSLPTEVSAHVTSSPWRYQGKGRQVKPLAASAPASFV